MMKINQFDMLLVHFSPVKGSEQDGLRPAVALQSNGLDDRGSITFVAPLTTSVSRVYSFETKLSPSLKNGLKAESKLLIRHIRSIDKQRIIKKMGVLEKKYHSKLLESIGTMFDLNQDFN